MLVKVCKSPTAVTRPKNPKGLSWMSLGWNWCTIVVTKGLFASHHIES